MKKLSLPFLLAHVLLMLLVAAVLLPGRKAVDSPAALLVGIVLFEGVFLLYERTRKGRNRHGADIMVILWTFLLLWELLTTKLDRMHPVLVPAPENVFLVFYTRHRELLGGVVSSLQLLLGGGLLGIAAGVALGLFVGWHSRLRGIFFPIAQVLAPISPIIYAPYLIALMPTFRSASMLIIFLGVFFPMFLGTILRVGGIEKRILDSARALCVSGPAIIPKILFPYLLPGIVGGLKVTLTTSITMLTFAEMMGATSGMGYFISSYAHYANYTNVAAGILLVGAVVTVLGSLVGWLQRRLVPWQDQQTT